METNFDVFEGRGVPFEDEARKQLMNLSQLPFIHKWIAVMPA